MATNNVINWSALTSNYVLLGNGNASPQQVAPGTSGNLLTSNGTTWQSIAPAASGLSQQQVMTITSLGV
jgi:hypothetical protein